MVALQPLSMLTYHDRQYQKLLPTQWRIHYSNGRKMERNESANWFPQQFYI